MTSETLRVNSERELAFVAARLGVGTTGALVSAERRLVASAARVPDAVVRGFRDAIRDGEDALGNEFCRLRAASVRREAGATYTPAPIVCAMVAWAKREYPARVVDPGAGSGRFLVAAGRAFPRARLVAVEKDPLAALLCRAHLEAAGLARRAHVVVGDYRTVELPAPRGRTLFVGNPPYVRHHGIEPHFKRWLGEKAATLRLPAKKLAGLHVYFVLRTALLGRTGDYGAFVTSAEWLDVNYGALFRELVLGPLGGLSLHAVAPEVRVFPDADATAVVTCFEIGASPGALRLRRVASADELGSLAGGRPVARERLARAARWTPFTRPPAPRPSGFVELGELCRVHRGQATGANRVWIEGPHSAMLPDALLHRAVTRARELFAAGWVLEGKSELRRVIDLPAELDTLTPETRALVERFLRVARRLGAHRGFIAEHRRAWWSVGLRAPAPILATYMARRPPAFVRNASGARHLNVAHGLYPRERLAEPVLDALARYLSSSTRLSDGRTYAGGLTKFEPKEMERLLVPAPEALAAWAPGGPVPPRSPRGRDVPRGWRGTLQRLS